MIAGCFALLIGADAPAVISGCIDGRVTPVLERLLSRPPRGVLIGCLLCDVVADWENYGSPDKE